MWERTLSQKLVRLFCEQKVIDEAKTDAYVYGYELLISSIVSILLVILIAAVCSTVWPWAVDWGIIRFRPS